MSADSEYTTLDLRRMDEQDARHTLTVAEFERWEKLHDLTDSAAETRERWADESEQVLDITVNADADALGTEVDVYGNDLLVHVDSEDRQFRQAAEALDDELQSTDTDEVDALDAETRERLADAILDVLDACILRWNGTEWGDLPDEKRYAVLGDARAKWGLDATLAAMFDIVIAIREDHEEKKEVVESFLGEERRGRR